MFVCWLGVNLPRWGLKLSQKLSGLLSRICVNLPRWGLKLQHYYEHKKRIECKFTPLGFETFNTLL